MLSSPRFLGMSRLKMEYVGLDNAVLWCLDILACMSSLGASVRRSVA